MKHLTIKKKLQLLCSCLLWSCLPCLSPLHLRAAEPTPSGGVGLGPALILVRDIRPGQTVDLAKIAAVSHSMVNNTTHSVELELSVRRPDTYGFKQFECGYEPAGADIGLALIRNQETASSHSFTLKPGERSGASVQITIPDLPEFWNRHLVIYVEGGAPARAAMGASLRMRARILIETASRDSAEHIPNTDASEPSERPQIALTPSLIYMKKTTNTTNTTAWTGSSLLRNNSKQSAQFHILRLHAVYPKEHAGKRMRFFAGEKHRIPDAEWASTDLKTIELAAGAAVTLPFSAAAGHSVSDPNWQDEVMFIGRLASADVAKDADLRIVNGLRYERIELLRLRYSSQGDPQSETKKE